MTYPTCPPVQELACIGIKEDFTTLVHYIVTYSPNIDIILYYMCKYSHKSSPTIIIKYLVNCGADVNYVDSIGNNCLYYLCQYNFHLDNIKTIKYLVENGANIHQKNTFGLSPVLVACSCTGKNNLNIELLDYLLKCGKNQDLIFNIALYYLPPKCYPWIEEHRIINYNRNILQEFL